MIELTNPTLRLNGIDLAPAVRSVSLAIEANIEPMQRAFAALADFNLKFRGRFEPSPRTYRALFGRQHPRIRRMHTAYRRRHGRGRR